jgi:hypothetical protein
MKSIVLSISLSLGALVLSAQENNMKKNKSSEEPVEYQYSKSGFEEGKQYVITRYDGVEYIGEILNDDGHEILMETRMLGKVYIPKYEIKSIIEIKEERSIIYNEYLPTGPFTTRYSFTTNALPIKKGENYGMLNLYGPEGHLALTNNLNIGIMASWIASPVVLATKFSFISKESKVNFSIGTLLGTSGYLNNFKGYGGLHWLNITIGNRKNNLTFSGGYAYLQTGIMNSEPDTGVYNEDDYFAAQEKSSRLLKMSHGPVFSVAGIFKIGAKASFVFDSMIGYFNYEKVSSDQEYDSAQDMMFYTVTRKKNAYSTALFLMPGVRFQNSDRKAFQICIAGISMFGDSNGSFPIPMCSWFYKF